MDEEALRAELKEVAAELEVARTEYASLGARIAGLEARQSALSRTLSAGRPTVAAPGPRYRTDAIVAVLCDSRTEMPIRGVMAALGDAGRPGESYDNVSADLAYLAERGRLMRVRRGVYATAVQHRSPQRCPAGHEFLWEPARGLCPYCSLSSQERIAGLQESEASSPCPPDCCAK